MEMTEKTIGLVMSIIVISLIVFSVLYILVFGSPKDWWQAVQTIFVGIFIFIYNQISILLR